MSPCYPGRIKGIEDPLVALLVLELRGQHPKVWQVQVGLSTGVIGSAVKRQTSGYIGLRKTQDSEEKSEEKLEGQREIL